MFSARKPIEWISYMHGSGFCNELTPWGLLPVRLVLDVSTADGPLASKFNGFALSYRSRGIAANTSGAHATPSSSRNSTGSQAGRGSWLRNLGTAANWVSSIRITSSLSLSNRCSRSLPAAMANVKIQGWL